MSAPTDPRLLKVHPLADLMPAMPDDEFDALKEDIRAHGLREPLVVFEGMILDGRHRKMVCERLGFAPPVRVFEGTEDDARALVISLNLRRRHLNTEQKRNLIAKLLNASPEKSNNAIATAAKVDDKTVAKVRADMEARSEIPNVAARTDTKGRAQPAKKPAKAKGAAASKPAAPTRPAKSPTPPSTPAALAERYRDQIKRDYLEFNGDLRNDFLRRLVAFVNEMRTDTQGAPAGTLQ